MGVVALCQGSKPLSHRSFYKMAWRKLGRLCSPMCILGQHNGFRSEPRRTAWSRWLLHKPSCTSGMSHARTAGDTPQRTGAPCKCVCIAPGLASCKLTRISAPCSAAHILCCTQIHRSSTCIVDDTACPWCSSCSSAALRVFQNYSTKKNHRVAVGPHLIGVHGKHLPAPASNWESHFWLLRVHTVAEVMPDNGGGLVESSACLLPSWTPD